MRTYRHFLRVPKRRLTTSLPNGVQAVRLVAAPALLKPISDQLGHFMNLLSRLVVFGGGGSLTGFAKYISLGSENPERLRVFLSAADAYAHGVRMIAPDLPRSFLCNVRWLNVRRRVSEIMYMRRSVGPQKRIR